MGLTSVPRNACLSLPTLELSATGKLAPPGMFRRRAKIPPRVAILDQCWPELTFDEQMRRAWITESTLCSARSECGPVPTAVSQYCVNSYLWKQLSLLPHAIIATLGEKAKKRTAHPEPALVREFIHARAAAPPGCNFKGARQSWDRIADAVRNRAERRCRKPRGVE